MAAAHKIVAVNQKTAITLTPALKEMAHTSFDCQAKPCLGLPLLVRHKFPPTRARFKVHKNSFKCKLLTCAALTVSARPEKAEEMFEVVIVGGGVAGLATAVALHKVGLQVLILEQAEGIREGGAALSLWGNGWKALEALGVAEELRTEYCPLTRVEICSKKGKLLRDFTIEECVQGPHEVRGVRRSHLLKSLAGKLPPSALRFASKPKGFGEGEVPGTTRVELEDGTAVTARVLLGCDGARSSVATWLNLGPPNYCGYSACRGIASFPGGTHGLGETIRMVWGEGVRAGMYPLNTTDVYWFTCFNATNEEVASIRNPGTDLLQLSLSTVEGWTNDVREAMLATPNEGISFSTITDRWTLPFPGTRWGKNCVTVLGDAAHPMTPNLGQGACTALEDAVIIARELAGASPVDKKSPIGVRRELGSNAEVEAALAKFDTARIKRTFPLTARAFAMGALLQLPYAPVCFLRDNVALPVVLKTDHFLDHALFDCGELTTD